MERPEHLEQADKSAKEQREIAAEEAKEEVLQAYFDWVSAILIDGNILAIATKTYSSEEEEVTPEQRELLDVSVIVIQARTLSILGRLMNDGQRKGSVIRFLVDSGVISRTKMSLEKADLENADLYKINLKNVNLRRANLTNANLIKADLRGADLAGATLLKANLGGAQLNGACFKFAQLSEANINLFTEVRGAKFAYASGLSEAQKTSLKKEGATFQLEKMGDFFDLP